MLNIYEMKTKT